MLNIEQKYCKHGKLVNKWIKQNDPKFAHDEFCKNWSNTVLEKRLSGIEQSFVIHVSNPDYSPKLTVEVTVQTSIKSAWS